MKERIENRLRNILFSTSSFQVLSIQTYQRRDLQLPLLAGWMMCTDTRATKEEVSLLFSSPLFSLVLFIFNISQPSSSSCLCVFPENDNPLYPPPPAYSPQPELNRNTLVPNVR